MVIENMSVKLVSVQLPLHLRIHIYIYIHRSHELDANSIARVTDDNMYTVHVAMNGLLVLFVQN